MRQGNWIDLKDCSAILQREITLANSNVCYLKPYGKGDQDET